MKSVLAVFSVVVLLFVASTGESSGTYSVKKGDTLKAIAKKHHISTADLKAANGLTSTKLTAGMTLSIPTKGDAAKATGQQSTRKVSAEKSNRATGEVRHTVQKGDTLEKIAKRYRTSEPDIRDLNNLSSAKLKVGQKLIVKGSEPRTYTVKKGDTITKIARKHRVTVEELKEINDLEGNSVKPGQELLLARSAKEQPEERSFSPASYNRKSTPVLASAKLTEVKALATSDDITHLGMTDRLMLFAKKLMHMPYRFGGNGSIGIDCSAYVQRVFSLAGVELPRSAREQYTHGEDIDRDALNIGDLVFFKTYASFPSHVGIYLGNNLFIHASSKSKQVTIDSLETPYYFKRFIGAKRLINGDEMQEPPLIAEH